jgi:hypothetical protein
MLNLQMEAWQQKHPTASPMQWIQNCQCLHTPRQSDDLLVHAISRK